MRVISMRSAAAAAAALTLTATALAQQPPTPAAGGTTQPAALSTPAVVDTNSPKAAVKSFVAAEIKGDAKAIHEVLLTNSPTEERMANSMADLAAAIADLDRAMIAKFGAEKTEPIMGDQNAALADVMAKLDKATEQVNGDSATVTSQPEPGGAPSPTASPAAAGGAPAPGGASPQDTMTLRKINGQWKVVVAEMAKGSSDENVQKTLSSVDAAVSGYRTVLSDLNAGKLATPAAVDAELQNKLLPSGMAPPNGAGAPPAK